MPWIVNDDLTATHVGYRDGGIALDLKPGDEHKPWFGTVSDRDLLTLAVSKAPYFQGSKISVGQAFRHSVQAFFNIESSRNFSPEKIAIFQIVRAFIAMAAQAPRSHILGLFTSTPAANVRVLVSPKFSNIPGHSNRLQDAGCGRYGFASYAGGQRHCAISTHHQ